MIDKVLEVGAGFDWITPLASMIGDVLNGPSHTFLITYGSCPLSGRDIEILLKRRGIKTWGTMLVSGTLMISVRLSQARWAQYLLEQAGVPLENPLPSQMQRDRSSRGRSQRGPQRGRQTAGRRSETGALLDSIEDVLNTRVF